MNVCGAGKGDVGDEKKGRTGEVPSSSKKVVICWKACPVGPVRGLWR